MRFVTDEGVAKIADATRARFELPRDEAGNVACMFVRVEAFALPTTHDRGRPLELADVAEMNVYEIAALHDRIGRVGTDRAHGAGQSPIPIGTMIFSQPIRFPGGGD